MTSIKRVKFCECWARDGLQSIATVIPTQGKIDLINGIQAAGFKKLEVTSFSNPKLLPQFADAEEVLKRIDRRDDVSYVVLMPNTRGFERLAVCQKEGYGATEIILMISASEQHNQLNFRKTHLEAMKDHENIMKQSHALGIKIIGCAGTVYGCPVAGDVPIKDVVKIIEFYLNNGAQSIMLGDTTGVANPLQVKRTISELQTMFPEAEFIAHFHDTRGTGIANSIAAIELGIQYVDSSLGAIGGQPKTGAPKYSLGFTGNACTEDLVAVLEEMGFDTGVDIEKMITLGIQAEQVIGQRLRSNLIYSGPVLHQPSASNKGQDQREFF